MMTTILLFNMILWVRNSGRAQLGSSVPHGVDVSHILVFNWWLVWSGRYKMNLLICQFLGRDSQRALEVSRGLDPSQESHF